MKINYIMENGYYWIKNGPTWDIAYHIGGKKFLFPGQGNSQEVQEEHIINPKLIPPMKITLIHPSRGRALKAKQTLDYWMERASGNNEIEHILSLDKDDNQVEQYIIQFNGKSKIFIEENDSVVMAANRIALEATGDIFLYLSDDFKCPLNWDKLIINKIGLREICMLRVNDKLQPMDNCVLTIPIMTKGLYNLLGYFFYPEYKSMWVDCDLYFVTKPHMIEAPELEFRHEHQKDGNDETYERSNLNWNQGVDIFNRRSAEFGWGRAFNRIP